MTALLSARAVTKTYMSNGEPLVVVKETSFSLRQGELALLMGPSGSGKTTLISILVGLLSATSGSVELCGQDITRMSENEVSRVRRERVGFVFQTDNLFPSLSAFDNVVEVLRLKGKPTELARLHAATALARVGLADRMHHKPGQLSGGQRQRVAVARAIASSPELLVGDEITAALDGETAMNVMSTVRDCVTATTAALIVTHDRRLVRFADRVIEMEDGRLVGDGAGAYGREGGVA